MDIRLYENYEDDGQLSMFGFDEPEFDMESELAQEKAVAVHSAKSGEPGDLHLIPGGSGIRIQRCSSCGKLLYVKEEAGGYAASCNNCGIEYFQKA
ncbi:MAG: hypothetical protein ACI4AB_07785 [Acetatifactor sp.]